MNKKNTSIKSGFNWVGLSLILSLLTSCSSILNTSKIHHLTTNYCEPTCAYNYTFVNKESKLTTQQDSLLRLVLSPQNYFLSQTIGIQNHIASLLECEKDTLKALLTRQEINDRITMAWKRDGCNLNLKEILTVKQRSFFLEMADYTRQVIYTTGLIW